MRYDKSILIHEVNFIIAVLQDSINRNPNTDFRSSETKGLTQIKNFIFILGDKYEVFSV